MLGLTLLVVQAARSEGPQLAPLATGASFSFVVLGDNRGDDSGQQPVAFRQILRAVREIAPNLVLNTGDMIYGLTSDESRAREQWRLYREAIREVPAPFFHVPGNHDLWDEPSARLYREMWGPTYYSFDYGPTRFIGLDTETELSRLGAAQFEWLKQQLEEAGRRILFVFLHRPLFPVDGAIGSSLDLYPEERDRLHHLFVRHRRAIKGVFLGHEHLYHFHEREGVPYYITGGAGANLYMAPELGGFHHFLLVRVEGRNVSVQPKKVGASAAPLLAPRRVAPGELLESWEQGLFGFAWNYTVTTELSAEQASAGQRGLRLNFDLGQYAWPVLVVPLPAGRDWGGVTASSIDVFAGEDLKEALSVTATVEGQAKHEAAPMALRQGWNTVRTEWTSPWLPQAERAAARTVGWSLSGQTNLLRGSVVFDNFQVERRSPKGEVSRETIESWERPLLWRVADESVRAQPIPDFALEGRHSLKIVLDSAQCEHPVLLARLNPPWDLSRVSALTVAVHLPDSLTGQVWVTPGLRSGEAEFQSRAILLKPGWNQVAMDLGGKWLPKRARAAVDQVQWSLSATNRALRGWVLFDDLRAERRARP